MIERAAARRNRSTCDRRVGQGDAEAAAAAVITSGPSLRKRSGSQACMFGNRRLCRFWKSTEGELPWTRRHRVPLERVHLLATVMICRGYVRIVHGHVSETSLSASPLLSVC